MRIRPHLLGIVPLLLSSCLVRSQVDVPVPEIRAAIPELRAQGTADVQAKESETQGLKRYLRDRQETIHIDQHLSFGDDSWTVRELIEDCTVPGKPQTELCKLGPLSQFDLRVRELHRRDKGAFLWGAIALGALTGTGAAVYCGLECSPGSKAKLGSQIALGALAGASIIGLILCIHNKTCHD